MSISRRRLMKGLSLGSVMGALPSWIPSIGDPRIAVGRTQPQGIELTVFMNEPGDEKLAVRRLKQIFEA